MPFCGQCGKQIAEGEVCGCRAAAVPPAPNQSAPVPPAAPVQPAPPVPPASPVAPSYEAPGQPAYGAPAAGGYEPAQQAPYGAGQPPVQPPVHPGQQAGGPPYGGAPVQPQPVVAAVAANPLFKSWVDTIKGIFSRETESTLAAAGGRQDMSWLLTLVAGCLASGLACYGLLYSLAKQGYKAMRSSLFGGYGSSSGSYEVDLEFGKLFGAGLLMFLIVFVVAAALAVAVLAITKKPVNLPGTLNMVAAAMVPAIVLILAGWLVGLVFATGGLLLMACAPVATTLLLYRGITGMLGTGKGPFWLFMGAYLVFMVVAGFLVDKIVLPMLWEGIEYELEMIMYSLLADLVQGLL